MRQKLLSEGAKELSYEIREIVKKANILQKEGVDITWENIGDPIQKHAKVPAWVKEIVQRLAADDLSYGYCDSKGDPKTREFLAARTNAKGGAQITSDDILFFNGLGDAISTLYHYLDTTSRIIGPSPAYSTHSSAEAAHANHQPLTYKLDPDNHWYPDMEDMRKKVQYNPNVVGILLINPDNPTGMVYPKEILDQIVELAKEFGLILISDEIYHQITYNGARAYALSEIIDDVPGIAMKGISKELPWPGARCGWIECYNRDKSKDFDELCNALDDAKMIEVCSTTLPQMAIPEILGDARFDEYRQNLNEHIGWRSSFIADTLSEVPELIINKTYGAFYNTIVFKEGVLKPDQELQIDNPAAKAKVEEWVKDVPLDFRFVYYLLGATGICVVPISSFCSDLLGFRVTLLEEDEEMLKRTFRQIRDSVREYLDS
ncbi:pyridoxal phosphate-dependent aminotransferase [Gracilimonas mengyeensis]|uniref:alanine transaminase n=1 Tax=Gracilimonas mengyeensis TaxID=1302730 RepID=A0A521DZP8_9BACT|nr:pyridoxal phosphate-dependent aminotransferase [Gracilimonas mengyeensis]SMO77176.1 Aspartate/methionine/tyrosine aminotransferase [Gracilimonas mengyeensis]